MAVPKKQPEEPISWVLIIFLLGIGIWPIGLILLFIKLFAPDEKTRKTTTASQGTTAASEPAAKKTQRSAGRASRAAKSVTRQPKMKKSNARLLQIIGGILLFAAVLGGAEYLVEVLSGNMYWLSDLLQMAALGAAGTGMVVAGCRMSSAMKRYARYLAVMGKRDAVDMEELARKLGYSMRQVETDLNRMIDKEYFGAGAYLNLERGCFYRTAEAEQTCGDVRKETSAKERSDGLFTILRDIRQVNDRIADPVLSAQIDRLEDITARIFRAAEGDPAKMAHINTFLTYYLPTTQKLLDSYAEFEAAGVEGENLRQAKENIRGTMENIVEGFAHQLDALYKADAMSVDQDIRVMETMLRRDTASAAKDFDLGGTAAQKMGE